MILLLIKPIVKEMTSLVFMMNLAAFLLSITVLFEVLCVLLSLKHSSSLIKQMKTVYV